MATKYLRGAIALALSVASIPALAQAPDEMRALEEVRNTVINLLEALVQKGVMTAEQAEEMVAAAQEKASVDAKARADVEASESDAVRVTYVPEIVRKQISDQVRAELKPEVAKEVVAQAKADGWGVPGALPDWIKNVRVYGDVRARAQGDLYASDNGLYLNFNEVNEGGGIGHAGEAALLNTTEDRHRMVGRVRAGLVADLGNAFKVDVRFASGNARSPVSTNQTLGNYGARWELNVDKAAVLWNPKSRVQELDFRLGRFSNPFSTGSELVWDADLTFEGVSATYAVDAFGRDAQQMERGLFVTIGAFPLQEVELSKDDKWLYAAQLGAQVGLGADSRLRFTAGYFDYENIAGVRNTLDSTVFDFTAPEFLQKGNTLFDIRNDDDPESHLFALAADYTLATAGIWLDLGFGNMQVLVGGEYVKNIGWEDAEIQARMGLDIEERTEGYEAGLTVGHRELGTLWDWRAFALYRYLERDAVLDAFADSDFHLGGTDAKGYELGFDLGLSRGAWLRLRYLTANEIDGPVFGTSLSPALGIDVWQVDFNGQF